LIVLSLDGRRVIGKVMVSCNGIARSSRKVLKEWYVVWWREVEGGGWYVVGGGGMWVWKRMEGECSCAGGPDKISL
jgi:hypothetical protein